MRRIQHGNEGNKLYCINLAFFQGLVCNNYNCLVIFPSSSGNLKSSLSPLPPPSQLQHLSTYC